MKIPKDDNGRVKRAGEQSNVSSEAIRALRNEEKKLRRPKTGVSIVGCDDEYDTASLVP